MTPTSRELLFEFKYFTFYLLKHHHVENKQTNEIIQSQHTPNYMTEHTGQGSTAPVCPHVRALQPRPLDALPSYQNTDNFS